MIKIDTDFTPDGLDNQSYTKAGHDLLYNRKPIVNTGAATPEQFS